MLAEFLLISLGINNNLLK